MAPSYDFKESERIVVPVEVAFRRTLARASATLVDTERGHMVWGLNRILPDGTREIIDVAADKRPDWGRQRTLDDGTHEFSPPEVAVRPGPESLRLHRLANGESYKRPLDLSAICDFSRPGTYHVQIGYDNRGIADERKDEWADLPAEYFASTLFGPAIDRNETASCEAYEQTNGTGTTV